MGNGSITHTYIHSSWQNLRFIALGHAIAFANRENKHQGTCLQDLAQSVTVENLELIDASQTHLRIANGIRMTHVGLLL
jgi:hypothetical protein